MAKLTPIPYGEIASTALNVCESLLHAWLPGGKAQGGEYKVTNPLRADNKAGSFSINISTGAWGDFATNDAGKDLISLYAYLHGLEQWQAAIEVADQIGFRLPDGCRPSDSQNQPRKQPIVDPETIKQAKPKEPNYWHPLMPVPANAPEAPEAHSVRRFPAMKWAYKDANGQLLGYIYRFNTSDGGKETIPLTYCRHEKTGKCEWRWMQWPEPNRPLYGLDRLAAYPDSYVLLLEGEKCADVGVENVSGVCVSWPGGSKAVDKVDWTPLAGRKIFAWPDCDAQREKLTKAEKDAGMDPLAKPLLPEHEQPGIKAMLAIKAKLLALNPATEFFMVDIPKPNEKPSGWDIADAVADGFSKTDLIDFIAKTREYLPENADDPAPDNVIPFKQKTQSTPNPAGAEEEKKPTWVDYLFTRRGDLQACLSNVVDIIDNDERWREVLAFDEFAQRVIKLKKPPFWNGVGDVGEWDAQDDARLAMWITKVWRFSPSAALVAEAIEVAARNNPVNPPKDWLMSLKWDGVHRVDTWMLDFMGVPLTDYSRRVARWFFMGMVKRVFEPGCKFDYCLVLEGPQGRKKSSALAVIGGEWYGDTDLDLHNKDSMSALRGKMLYEFSEMGSVAKAEATKQKSFLSRQVDEYRPVYGRREIRVPRQLVFAGTTNEWEWNKDPTGGRRFWPVDVLEEIDVAGLKEVREQLFAEAVVMVNQGLRYWPTMQEQTDYFDKEQLKRTITESFIDGIEWWVDQRAKELEPEFTLFMVATDALKMDASKITRDIQTRIGNALRQLGCTRVERRKSKDRFWYKPPVRNLATSTAETTADDGGIDDEINF